MKCKYCDSIIPDNADSCPNCGAQVIHKDENKNEKAHTDKNKAQTTITNYPMKKMASRKPNMSFLIYLTKQKKA